MKTIFDHATREQLIQRIKTLDATCTAQWGKMDVKQMILHCTKTDSSYLSEVPLKQVFIGKLIGKMVLKSLIGNEKPFKPNSPTSKGLIISETIDTDIESLKQNWLDTISRYATFSKDSFLHPFFGKVTKEQMGYLSYKHIDHHLRQFGK